MNISEQLQKGREKMDFGDKDYKMFKAFLLDVRNETLAITPILYLIMKWVNKEREEHTQQQKVLLESVLKWAEERKILINDWFSEDMEVGRQKILKDLTEELNKVIKNI